MNKFAAILVIASLAVGGMAIHWWHQRNSDREQIAILEARIEAARAAALVTSSAPALEALNSRADGKTATVMPAGSAPSVEALSKPSTRVQVTREMLTSPEHVERVRALNRASAPSQYPDLEQALDLSPEEVNRLFDILSQRATNAAAPPNAGESALQIFQREGQAREAEIAALLGSKYAQWKTYKQELPARHQVKDLEAVLDASGTPLSDERARSLVSAITSAVKAYDQQNGPGESPEKRRIRVDAASAYLSPQQQEAFRKMLDRQLSSSDRPPGTTLFNLRPASNSNAGSPAN
jgi:hypothetical protein